MPDRAHYILILSAALLSIGALPQWIAEHTYTQDMHARSAFLLELGSNTPLFEKAADTVYPLASLTKLMTLYIALQEYEHNIFRMQDRVEIPAAAYAEKQPAGSSLMFLAANQQTNWEDLLYGLMVSSGNDAATALAVIIEGSVPAFVRRMNDAARTIGMTQTTFADPSGLDSGNRSSGRDISFLVGDMFRRWPSMVTKLSSQKEFSYPREDNRTPETSVTQRAITQKNRNRLLWEYKGADGLKTGFTEEAGYTFIATALRNGRRLIVILLSVPGRNYIEGNAHRIEDATELLNFGFSNFDTHILTPESVHAYVPGGTPSVVALQKKNYVEVTLPQGGFTQLMYRIEPAMLRWAPLHKGSILATAVYILEGTEVYRLPLVTTTQVEDGGIVHKIIDAIQWWGRTQAILVFAE